MTYLLQCRPMPVSASLAALLLSTVLGTGNAVANTSAENTGLDGAVLRTLQQCREISSSCAAATRDAEGILVFPSVVKADLLIGGAGGNGALMEDGKITGYYNIGAASAGFQAGIDSTSEVYVIRSTEELNDLKTGPNWDIGATAGVTVVDADANARATSGDETLAYLFDSQGLHGGVSVELMNVWKADHPRPQSR